MLGRCARGVLFASAGLGMGLLTLAGCDGEFGRTGGPIGNEAQEAADLAGDLGGTSPAGAPGADSPAQPTPESSETMPAPATPSAGEAESSSHVGKQTKEVLNAKELAGDPNWTVAASDPTQVRGFSAAGTAYNRAAALGGTANLETWIKLEHASNGTYPTYAQLTDYIAKNPVDMPALRVYQHYGYDEATGQVVILENQAEKKERQGSLGIE